MTTLEIDDLIDGIATGIYPKRLGSQFGALWGFDGLLVAEAGPEEYAAFGAGRSVNLCHSHQINWEGKEWDVILAYLNGGLIHITIHTADDETTFSTISRKLNSKMSETMPSSSNELEWNGVDGTVTVTRNSDLLYVSLNKIWPIEPRPWWKFW
jgi:hypothetical protein